MIKDTELIQLSFEKIMQTRAYTMVVLGTSEKKFSIYLDPQIGKAMQLYLTGQVRARPLTHDLIDASFKGLGVRVKQVVINDIKDTVFYARLFLEQMVGEVRHVIEIDCRPSDALTLALINDIPVYCTKEVLQLSFPFDE